MTVTFDNPSTAPSPMADRYSNLVTIDLGASTMIILSGQVAFDDDGSLVGTDMTTQSERIFTSIEAMLAAHGAGFEHVVNLRSYLTNLDQLGEYAAVRRKYFTGTPPTSTAVEISRLFLPEALLEVEITAIVPK